MSQFPCIYCDAPIPTSEAARSSLCPVCSRPLSVCGRFRLQSLLSKSEHDRVYAAIREPDGLPVSVKILLAKEDDWAAQSEFERVARALQGMKSRALPQIHGWERGAQGRLILVRERLGGTLAERHAHAPPKVLEALLSLLSQLHEQSPPILHRDIRAENILFRSADDWSPVLADFVPAGEATVQSDLRALGAALPNCGEVAGRLASGGFASAGEALHALKHKGGRSPEPPPARPKREPRIGLWVTIAVFLAAGMAFRLAQHGSSKPSRGKSAVDNYRAQCDRGEGLGCFNLAYVYEKGQGVDKDETRAAALYRKGCDLKEKLACNNLAVLYEAGRGVAKDPARATPLYQRACDQRDWLACRNLGDLYVDGVGVEKDRARGADLYQKACDNNEYKACYRRAVLYETGKGDELDLVKAMGLYQRACDGQYWDGCTSAGWKYTSGEGVPVDHRRARQLYEKACDHGEARACNNLGMSFEKGRAVPVDLVRAAQLYRTACEGGDNYGCNNLGYFYVLGKGVTQNLETAAELYEKSCKLGYDEACDALKDLRKQTSK